MNNRKNNNDEHDKYNHLGNEHDAALGAKQAGIDCCFERFYKQS